MIERLSREHFAQLRALAISAASIRERGYRSAKCSAESGEHRLRDIDRNLRRTPPQTKTGDRALYNCGKVRPVDRATPRATGKDLSGIVRPV